MLLRELPVGLRKRRACHIDLSGLRLALRVAARQSRDRQTALQLLHAGAAAAGVGAAGVELFAGNSAGGVLRLIAVELRKRLVAHGDGLLELGGSDGDLVGALAGFEIAQLGLGAGERLARVGLCGQFISGVEIEEGLSRLDLLAAGHRQRSQGAGLRRGDIDEFALHIALPRPGGVVAAASQRGHGGKGDRVSAHAGACRHDAPRALRLFAVTLAQKRGNGQSVAMRGQGLSAIVRTCPAAHGAREP